MSANINELTTAMHTLFAFDEHAATTTELDTIAPTMTLLAGWLSSKRAALAGRRDDLARTTPTPEEPHRKEAAKSRQRAKSSARDIARNHTLRLFPLLRDALERGPISIDHVDSVTAALRDLTADQLVAIADLAPAIVDAACAQTPEQLDITVRRLVRDLLADDGLTRLARQRANTKLRVWTDRDTGMIKMYGEFDPERGLILLNRLQAALEAQHARPVPADCPDDPGPKNDHLRALGLLALVERRHIPTTGATGGTGATDIDPLFDGTPIGGGPDDARLDMIIVVDLDTLIRGLHDQSIIDASQPIELPVDTLRRLACCANIIPVVLDSNGVVLDQGRTTRLANRPQRRALRAMYPTCAEHGCTVAFDHCKIHHIEWWGEHHGATDLDNLIPLCERHHHLAHEGRWRLTLDPHTRVLTTRRPDGTTTITPPPRAGRGRHQTPTRGPSGSHPGATRQVSAGRPSSSPPGAAPPGPRRRRPDATTAPTIARSDRCDWGADEDSDTVADPTGARAS